MLVVRVRNVNDAWRVGLQHLGHSGVVEQTRAGVARVYPEPVTTVYLRPWERVLWCPQRDANPFFHLFESMWMLAGRKDATWLDTYVRDFSSRYAEVDGTMHGAYGYRWRVHFGMDQIRRAVSLLRQDPTTRQVVLQMWDPAVDLGAVVRDKPCNVSVAFRTHRPGHLGSPWTLDMTVFCRSNDMVWGAYGANSVHMSVMHEFVASAAGMMQGTYTQVSNNYHAYEDVLDRMMPRSEESPHARWRLPEDDWYRTDAGHTSPLFPGIGQNTGGVLAALGHETQVDYHLWEIEQWSADPSRWRSDASPALYQGLLVPMSRAHEAVAEKRYTAASMHLEKIQHADWRRACEMWMSRRVERLEARELAAKKAAMEAERDSVLLLPEAADGAVGQRGGEAPAGEAPAGAEDTVAQET